MHQKHKKLVKPRLGCFHRDEWSIVGAPSLVTQKLAVQLAEQFSPRMKIGYLDAGQTSAGQVKGVTPYSMIYKKQTKFHQFQFKGQLETYHFRWWFNDQDILLINGNHYRSKKQIVVLDPVQKDYLRGKLDQLDQVELILTTNGQTDIYPFLKDHLASLNQSNIPILPINQTEDIYQFILNDWEQNKPPVKGLVLAGGKSQRMGEDKGGIVYHGVPQREYTANLLSAYCYHTYISCTNEQAETLQSNYELLPDKLIGLGPFGAIVSAFQTDPNAAWLVVACDLPLLNPEAIGHLIENRNRSKLATTYQSPVNGFPEPLVTIWEPRSYPVLLQFLAQGYSCPRKVLINNDIELIHSANPTTLKNVNNPEERKVVEQILAEGNKT